MDDRERIISLLLSQIPVLQELFVDSENENVNNEINEIEECLMVLINRRYTLRQSIPRIQSYVEEVIPLYSDELFKTHFRLNRTTFDYVLNLIKPSLTRCVSGHQQISPVKQLLIAIWRMATPDSYRSICVKFNVSARTALRCVRRVSGALCKLAPVFITWPEGDRLNEIAMGFAESHGFPGIIGAVDGTHVNIKAPRINPESYINRKGHHSIQLQAVCDHQLRFTHCYTGHVGSVHDQRVFRLSEVYEYLNDPRKFPNGTHLVGDAAYSIHENLMIPYRDNGHLTESQRNYNFIHSSARIAIERAFGLLKGRFRSLLTVLDMVRVDLIPEFILACCVLHNICLLQNDEVETTDIDVVRNEDNMEIINRTGERNAGCIKRDNICAALRM